MSDKKTYRKGFAARARMVLLVAAALVVMPLSALDLSQKINVTGINMTVKDLLKQIEVQTGYTFAFNKSAFDTARRVNISANEAEVGDVLNVMLENSGFSYIINNKHIIILPVQTGQGGGSGTASQSTAAKSPRATAQPVKAPSSQVAATSQAPAAQAPVRTEAAPKAEPLPQLPVVKAEEIYMQVVDDAVYMVIPGQQVVQMASIEPKQYVARPMPVSKVPNVPKSPRLALKTNLLFDATTTMNLGLEVRVSPKNTIELTGYYNPWSWNNNRKFKSIMVQPEFRYWICDPFAGHFIGVHAQWAHYNFGNLPLGGFRDSRYQGELYGAGVSYGYSWYLGKRWALEATVGVGYNYLDYERFDCAVCGTRFGWENNHYFGITKLGLNLSFLIK